MRAEDPKTKRALRQLVRHPSIAAKAVADDLGVAYRTLMAWLEPDGPVPTLDQVRQLVAACARQDAEAARRLAEELYGLPACRWFLAAEPAVAGSAPDVVHEVLEAGAATGRVTGWLAEAAVGGFSPAEAEEGCSLMRAAERELAEAQAALEVYRRPQLRLAGVLR